MPITLAYKVHSANVEPTPTDASVNGTTVVAMVDRLVVELVAADGHHGHTFRLPVMNDENLKEAAAHFAVGSDVTVTLTPAGE
jgi:hypothetical protein